MKNRQQRRGVEKMGAERRRKEAERKALAHSCPVPMPAPSSHATEILW